MRPLQGVSVACSVGCVMSVFPYLCFLRCHRIDSISLWLARIAAGLARWNYEMEAAWAHDATRHHKSQGLSLLNADTDAHEAAMDPNLQADA